MKKLILIVLLCFMLAACSFGAKSEFDTNHAKWQNAGITHYRYSLFIGCFCAFRDKMPLSIEVKNGEVLSMTVSDGTPILPTDPQFETFSHYSTIERIFSALKADLGGDADEVTVTYDSTYGFPLQINIDFIKQAADDELSLTVSKFEKLP
jgi:uncharacterized protein DUF6174